MRKKEGFQPSAAQKDLLVRASLDPAGEIPTWGTFQKSLNVLVNEGLVKNVLKFSGMEREKMYEDIRQCGRDAAYQLTTVGNWETAYSFLARAKAIKESLLHRIWCLTEKGRRTAALLRVQDDVGAGT